MSAPPTSSAHRLEMALPPPLGVRSHRRKLLAAIAEISAVAQPTWRDRRKASRHDTWPNGSSLRARRSEGEREQVTVLLADVVGSTQLIEGMDPELAAAQLSPALQAMMTSVHRYEGTVNKVQGDGVMALFGAPLAHEDHALRANLAALAMQQAVKQHLAGDLGIAQE